MRDVHGAVPTEVQFRAGLDDMAVGAQHREGLEHGLAAERHAARMALPGPAARTGPCRIGWTPS